MERLVAAVIVRDGALALLAPPAVHWRTDPESTFVPVEFPGTSLTEGQAVSDALARLGERLFGQPLRAFTSPRTYGASAAHAIDRIPYAGKAAARPLAVLERFTPADWGASEDVAGEHPASLRRVLIEQFIAAPAHEPLRHTPASAALLWLPLPALRQVVRGVSLRELLAREGVTVAESHAGTLDPDAVVYLPSEYGERYLLRVVAKYGDQILRQGGRYGA